MPKNPQDATLRNVRAAKKRDDAMAAAIEGIGLILADITERLERLELAVRDVPDDEPVE